MMIIIINTVYKSILHSRLYYIKVENLKKREWGKSNIVCAVCWRAQSSHRARRPARLGPAGHAGLYIVRLIASIDGKRPDAFRSNRPRKKEPRRLTTSSRKRKKSFSRFCFIPLRPYNTHCNIHFLHNSRKRPHPSHHISVYSSYRALMNVSGRYQSLYRAVPQIPFFQFLSKRPPTRTKKFLVFIFLVLEAYLYFSLKDWRFFLAIDWSFLLLFDADSWSN